MFKRTAVRWACHPCSLQQVEHRRNARQSPTVCSITTHRLGAHNLILAMIALAVFARSGQTQTVGVTRCSAGVHEATGTVFFPQDHIFCPLLADPKEPRTFLSYQRGEFGTVADPSGKDTNIGSIGVGDTFGLVRWGGTRPGEGVQLDAFGSIFAQFDLGAPSTDLINADYLVGFPLTIRRRGFSARIRVYHQSSHLGDEFLLRDQKIQRENLSFESVELLLSQEIGPLRVYAGGEDLFRREPDALAPQLVHGGLEFRQGSAGPWRFVAAGDVKATRQHDWSPATSVRTGVEVARSGGGYPARAALMLELYKGPSPYGQFFQDDIKYIGIGLHLGF